MTDLHKTVKRRTVRPIFDGGHRRITVALEPGDMIALRTERSRTWYRLSIEGVYQMALRAHIESEQRAIEKRVKELVKQGATRRQAKKQARMERKARK